MDYAGEHGKWRKVIPYRQGNRKNKLNTDIATRLLQTDLLQLVSVQEDFSFIVMEGNIELDHHITAKYYIKRRIGKGVSNDFHDF